MSDLSENREQDPTKWTEPESREYPKVKKCEIYRKKQDYYLIQICIPYIKKIIIFKEIFFLQDCFIMSYFICHLRHQLEVDQSCLFEKI